MMSGVYEWPAFCTFMSVSIVNSISILSALSLGVAVFVTSPEKMKADTTDMRIKNAEGP